MPRAKEVKHLWSWVEAAFRKWVLRQSWCWPDCPLCEVGVRCAAHYDACPTCQGEDFPCAAMQSLLDEEHAVSLQLFPEENATASSVPVVVIGPKR